jgi:hypothetical protein
MQEYKKSHPNERLSDDLSTVASAKVIAAADLDFFLL